MFQFLLGLNPFKEKIDIYTDGSHKGKWGSWAFVIVSQNKIIHESSGRERKTNSHRMEFQAAIEALSYLKAGTKANLFSDSKALVNTLNGHKKIPTSNLDQYNRLSELRLKRKISCNWVKAHSGIAFNERCDELCLLSRTSK
jgi:ribonuclease HI